MDVPAGVAINAHRAGLHQTQPLKTSSQDHSQGNKVQLDAVAFKDQLDSCLAFFRSLIEAMVRSTKASAFAGPYFHTIIRLLDNDLVRIEIWASDVGAYDPDFGKSAQAADIELELTRYVTIILKDLQSRLEECKKQVEEMQDLIKKMSGRRSNDMNKDRQLRNLLARVDKECRKMGLAIRSIVSLTEAFQMEQAVKLQSGPFARLRQQHLEALGRFPGLSRPSPTFAGREPQPVSIEKARSEELGPWSRKLLLSLDADGTRCFSTILILKALIAEIAVQEQTTWPRAYSSASPLYLEPQAFSERGVQHQATDYSNEEGTRLARYLPCHYFDCTIGTSFGGLIATMLSRLRMNVEECLEDFQTLLDNVWSKRRFFPIRPLTPWTGEKYGFGTLELALKDMVKRRSPDGENTTFRQQNEDTCRCILPSFVSNYQYRSSGKRGAPNLFYSYHRQIAPNERIRQIQQKLLLRDASLQHSPIWQILRATTTTPTYFTPIHLAEDIEDAEYLDAICVTPNPSFVGYSQIKAESGNIPGVVVSIGSGANLALNRSQRFGNFRQYEGLDARSIHESMLEIAEIGMTLDYTRLNVQEGLDGIALDEWKGKHGSDTLRLIREKTEDYLRSNYVKRQLAEAARVLIEARRERACTEHWERFCHGTEYVCTVIDCMDSAMVHRERGDLRRHLEHVHQLDLSSVETVLDQGRRFPLHSAKSK